jgi:archaellum component FlaC
MTTEERLLRLENAFATLVELAGNIDERLDDNNSRSDAIEANLSALSDIVAEVAKNQRRTDEQLNNLTINQKRTDEQLNNLAILVERYISGGGNQSS